ncbi:hypothetical protein BUALT_Bualt01G0219300 [Buddleja alternifolia]|uniref:DUF4378 domain-containing protein n=1 Tax=Buddleja alternifolia TaxID=168488 RepID=A0AAV6YJJ9_9LAMI|nr:hypothetical protein BUALT_Bualt01G0219300 [Buddleja alternifolia]
MVSIENRPRMLKEFLRDDSLHSCSSSPSSGFTMYPRKKLPCNKSMVQVSSKSTKPSIVLLRSRSKKAISAIHKVINVVKFFQFASVKSPLVLPRSISRKMLKRSYMDKNDDVLGDVSEVKVKVKDILRWKSFRDLVEDKSKPLDLPSSPIRSITTATTTTTSCSKNSSWCDSDFTEEELPRWCGENEEFLGKKCLHKGEWSCEDDDEQQSPISVLDSPFREVEESISPFHPSLANIQKAKCILTTRIQDSKGYTEPKYTRRHSTFTRENRIFEGVEEKAKQLFSHFKESNLSENNNSNKADDDDLILDFFMYELSINGNLHDCEILRIAKSWKNGEYDDYEWEVEEKRDAFVKDMEKGVCWNKFQQEQEEMPKEFEMVMLNELIDEVLVDLIY